MRLPGRSRLPDEVTAVLDGGERVLAAARAADGTWVVGTRDQLVAAPPGAVDPTSVQRWAWETLQRADWDLDSETLTVSPVAEYGQRVQAATYQLPDPGDLLTLVRERVSASVVLQRRTNLERRRGFIVIARRPPSGLGEVSWAVEYDPGVDPADPFVAAAADVALGEAQESLGLS